MQIYVELLDEGTTVWRPVEAVHIDGDRYRILTEPIVEETWAFHTGEIVRCRLKRFSDGAEGLAAYEGVA